MAKIQRPGQPARSTVTAATARFSGQVTYPDGVSVRVAKVERGVETGQGAGVFPGRKYVAISFEFKNGASSPLDLNHVVVTALAGNPPKVVNPTYIASSAAADFFGALAPGSTVMATYAFAMSPGPRDSVTAVIDFDAAHTSATLTGPFGS